MAFPLANIVWPSLVLTDRLLCWWIVAIGLLVEFACLFWLTQASATKAAAMTLTMNLISALIGIVAIPLSGVLWAPIAAVVDPVFGWGMFNPLAWVMSALLAALVNAIIETASLRIVFKVSWTGKVFGWVFLANMVTAGLAFATIYLDPPKL